MRTFVIRAWAVVQSALLAMLVAGTGSLIWGALIVANVMIALAIRWSVPVMALALVVLWQYLGGRWAPRRTSAARRALLRAFGVSRAHLAWALLAGALSLLALVGLWIVLVELTGVGGNPTIPSSQSVPPLALALALVMGSFVSSSTEEFAFRGYAQVTLERAFPGIAAVVISSLYFALWHGPTQGFAWSKLLFFFVVGLVFGTTAYLTQSILPAWPAHLAGDLIFFFLVWPHDSTRRLILRDGADLSFWLFVAQTVVFGTLAILAFTRLARTTHAARVAASPVLAVTSSVA